MARNTKVAMASRIVALDAELARMNSGKIRYYTAPRPASADVAISTQTLLAEQTFGNPAFAGAADVGGNLARAAANAITSDAAADATGQAVWARLTTSAGAACEDVDVGSAAAGDTLSTHDILLSNNNIQAGAVVSLSSLTVERAA